ncbi:MAG: RluA family pseudouridine synthase [Clostridia bacterium]|nr:RluA family pseudouridine synthase [Clostridia bacterium]
MNFIVDKENASKRLDLYLSDILKDKDITRSYIKNLIDENKVLVNGAKVKSGYKIKLNDNIEVEIIERESENIVAEEIPLEIVYEDEDIIIVNKAKGMVVHPANGNYTGTMVNSLMHSHKDNLSSINGVIRPGIVHRIDKDTSGILVVAKNDNAHKKLSEQFKVHSIKRKYVALVKGIVKEDTQTIDLPIGRSTRDRKKMAVTDKNSRNAVTHIRVLKRFYASNVTLVEAELETGRTHQIRVHMTHLHHPLVGDEVYGKKDPKFKVEGQMLHAKYLGFIHPSTNEFIEFDSNLPKYFEDILVSLENKEKAAK